MHPRIRLDVTGYAVKGMPAAGMVENLGAKAILKFLS